jgi:hypothetical protein
MNMEATGFVDTQPLDISDRGSDYGADQRALEPTPKGSVLVLAVALGFGLFWWLTQRRGPRMKVLPISPRRGVR